MKKTAIKFLLSFMCVAAAVPASAQFNLKKAIGGATKAVQAATLTDAQMAEYVKESVDWMDKNNPVTPDDNPYTIRLKKLTEGITEADGIPLNRRERFRMPRRQCACVLIADGHYERRRTARHHRS